MMWSLPEPEVDISLTVLFTIMLCTDKPLILLWLCLNCWKKWIREQGTTEEKYKVSSNGVVGSCYFNKNYCFPEITMTRSEDLSRRFDAIAPKEEHLHRT